VPFSNFPPDPLMTPRRPQKDTLDSVFFTTPCSPLDLLGREADVNQSALMNQDGDTPSRLFFAPRNDTGRYAPYLTRSQTIFHLLLEASLDPASTAPLRQTTPSPSLHSPTIALSPAT